MCLGPLYLVVLVLVCLFVLSDGSGLDAHSDAGPVPAEKRCIFQFFSEREVLNLTLAILHSHLGCNFQYSVCFLFSVTDLDGVGEHSGAVPVPAESRRIFQPKKNNRNFAFSNRNGTMENVHFEMEA